MLIDYKLGSLEAKLGAKIASVTSGHNVTCFDYEVMISPLFRWPNSLCHYMMTLPAINTDASKHEKEQISRAVQEMFEEADMWMSEE
ncbi:virulence protein [Raoultella ornithinolytica]|nr:virulence protein [Raoultella ornithinolytica]